MDLKSGYPFWLIKNGLLYDYPKLPHDFHTEVVIIGGGISGALVAYHLIEAGVDCIVVDARAIGLGSTCASTSLLQYEIDVPLFKLKELVGPENAIRAYQLCMESIEKLGNISKKIGLDAFEPKQSVYYAADPSHMDYLSKEYDARRNAGFDVTLIGSNEIKEAYGFEAPSAIVSSIAAETDAYSMTHLLHQHGIKKGLKVFDRTEVERVSEKGNEVIVYTHLGYRITAKKVVYATGYEVTEMLDKNIVSLHSTFACASEQFTGEINQSALLWNTASPYFYMRTTKDNRILIGGRDDKYNNTDRRDKLLPKKALKLVEDFHAVFPDVEFIPEYSWAGTFGSTKDGLPYIGIHPKYSNSYFALGFGGNGITFSLIASEIIRDLYLGKPNNDVSVFSFNR